MRGRGGFPDRYRHIRRLVYDGGLFPKLNLFLRILLMIFGVSFSLMLILFCLLYLADIHGLLDTERHAVIIMFISVLAGGSLLSLVMSVAINSLVIQPMRQILNAIDQVSGGNFDVRISTDDTMEIGFFADTINQMIESLGNLETLRNDFIANVSHEFKTPLAAIQGYAELLQNEDLTAEERRQYANMVYASAKRLSVLSSHILEMSKLEHGDIAIENSEFMLDEHLRQALLLLQADWQEKDIELDLDLAEVKYLGCDELLMQVWLNLLGNAIKFSPPGAPLHIKLEKLPCAVQVTIRDHGIGIAAAEHSLIFEKFYQADTSHKTEGNGLGLAMVRQIINLLGAEISVESAPGAGAAFIVTLPMQ